MSRKFVWRSHDKKSRMRTKSLTADTMLEGSLCRWENIGKMSLDWGGNDSQPWPSISTKTWILEADLRLWCR